MDNETVTQIIEVVTGYGLNIVGGIVILTIGWMVAGWAKRTVRNALSRSERIDQMLAGFFASLVKYIILIVTVLAVLNRFGVQTASLIAVLGAAGLAIGLALQGTLSSLAAGVMIIIFRPFSVGQFVEIAGHSGTVKGLNLFTTELATPDNVQIVIPNSSVWGSSVVNYSHHTTRRVDMVLGVGYDDDIGQAIETVNKVLAAESRLLSDPEALVVVGELADSSVNLTIRVWVKSGDYWAVKFDLTRALKEAVDAAGLSIPFPQRDVHLHQVAAAD